MVSLWDGARCMRRSHMRTARLLPSDSSLQATGVHTFAAASAGAIATMVTNPFDVIKVRGLCLPFRRR